MKVERRRGRVYLDGREYAELGARPCRHCGDFLLPNRGPSRVVLPHAVVRAVSLAQYRRSARRGRQSDTTILGAREVADSIRRGHVAEPDPRPGALVAERPVTRADCADGPRPCPWVSCRHHNYLEVGPEGSIRLNHPDVDPAELADSCSLDVADEDGSILNRVATTLNLTRERTRQVETKALSKVRRMPPRTLEAMRLHLDADPG